LTWIVSPGSPIRRLMKSVEVSVGFLKTMTSPRSGSVKKIRPDSSGSENGSEYRLYP
jgi:hypothetical protein